MDTVKVLEEYKNGDDSKRLSLFLAYRELREQFWSIEQECSHDDFTLFKFPWTRRRRMAPAN